MVRQLKNNFNQFEKAFNKAIDPDRKEKSFQFAREVILSTLTHLVIMSPVLEGYYRSAHTIKVGGELPTLASLGVPTVKQVNQIIEEGKTELENLNSLPNHVTVTISNSLPYAWKIEFGHSQQRPKGVYNIAYTRAIKLWENGVK